MSSQISFFFFFSFFILLVIVVSAKWARCLKLLALLAWNGVSAKSRIQQKLIHEFKKQKEKKKKKKKEKVTKKYTYQKSLSTNYGTLIFFVGEQRAPICCAQVKYFSKLNSINRKEVDIYIYIHTRLITRVLCVQ